MVGLALSCCGECGACFLINAERNRQQQRERRQGTSAPPAVPAVSAGVCAVLFVCTLLRYYCMQYVPYNCAWRRRHFPVSSTAPDPQDCFETSHYLTPSDLHETFQWNPWLHTTGHPISFFLTRHISDYPPKIKMGDRFRRR